MLTRDSYVALLEKRAAESDIESVQHIDSAQVTTSEHNSNKEDNRQYLHGIFPNAGEVQSNQTATVKKLFNNTKDAITSNPLMKLAEARRVFFGAINANGMAKTASPMYLELMFSSFKDELEKIAALKPQNLAQVAAKNQVAMSRPAKVWDLSSPASVAGAAAKPAMQGSGTSVHAGGILGRLGIK